MLISGIKSKPVYSPLEADTRGRYHLMLAIGGAATALERVLAQLSAADPDGLARARVLFAPEAATTAATMPATAASATAASATATPDDLFGNWPQLDVRLYPDIPALLAALRVLLDESLMGTRLYVAAPESFIGRAVQLALEFNMNQDEIRAEALGSLARRVHCIHCRTTTEDVRTNIVECGGCGRWLLVRDHYSRRLAAYMGVMVDAESPGERPAVKEIFP
jgi:hypothetical protein